MLVLSRQRDEAIMIGDDIQITVVDIRGDKVRLGISAPRDIQVHRKEVYEAIKNENTDASRVNVADLGDAPQNAGRAARNNGSYSGRNGRAAPESANPAAPAANGLADR